MMVKFEKAVNIPREELMKEHRYSHTNISTEMTTGLRNILYSSGNETELHNYLTQYPELLYRALYKMGTGHHDMIILSKQALIPKTTQSKGMIPDFILGAKNSEGRVWFVIELKGYNDTLFSISNSEIRFSTKASNGICQLMEYLDKSSEIQSHIRDYLKLDGFRNPKGILIIGNNVEIEQVPRKMNLRRMFHEITPCIRIVNYDCLL